LSRSWRQGGEFDFPAPVPNPAVATSNPQVLLPCFPGDGTGVSYIVPAVPSSTGLADVFAVNADCNVQAITSGGTIAWTSNIGVVNPDVTTCNQFVPDFQGGLVVVNSQYIYKLDGITGKPYQSYTSQSGSSGIGLSIPVVHTDGTIFAVDGGDTLVAINPLTGQPNFSVHLEDSTSSFSETIEEGGGFCQSSNFPPGGAGAPSTSLPTVGSLIIAGDGYAYVPYLYYTSQGSGIDYPQACKGSSQYATAMHLRLLRVGTGGDSYTIALGDWDTYVSFPLSGSSSWTNVDISPVNLITNSDQGVLASWEVDSSFNSTYNATSSTTFNLATTQGAGVVSQSTMSIPGEAAPVQPVLQRQDGNFVGTVGIGPQPGQVSQTEMIGFTSSGGQLFSVPNDAPQIATADNGVIGASGTTYDQSGNVNGYIASLPMQSWTGNSYRLGSVEQIGDTPIIGAASIWSWAGSNPSGSLTAARPWYFRLTWQNDFTFTPDYPTDLSSLTTGISQWAATIKQSALQEAQDAYSGVPVTVFEGQSGGDGVVTIVNSIPGVQLCGDTNPNNPAQHQVDYSSNMEEAQAALQVTISNSQTEQTVLASDTSLFQAIGRGIGTSSAHEIAHQFLLACCDMDSNPQTDPNARGTFNATGCNGLADPSPWTGYWPSPVIGLHWEAPALTALGQCLGKGWANFYGQSCHN
jgi:hypothetical protein